MKRKSLTAEEALAELNADPDFRAAQREREQARLKKEAEFHRAEAPLLEELNRLGYQVESARDLLSTARSYTNAIPVLLKHLRRPYPDRIREGIARALAVPEAHQHWNTLLRMFEEEMDPTTSGVKWALGCALSAAAHDDVIGDVVRLVQDLKHGDNRAALLDALARSSSPRARNALTEAAKEPGLASVVEQLMGEKSFQSDMTTVSKTVVNEDVSTNLDVEYVQSFLARVATQFPGGLDFEASNKIVHVAKALPPNETWSSDLKVSFGGRLVSIRIELFKDDVDAVDLYFFAPPEIASVIGREMNAFVEELGI